MKFVDVKNDVAFRKIFGNENKKVILISFLNAVLGLENEEQARERCLETKINRGIEAARAAVEISSVLADLRPK